MQPDDLQRLAEWLLERQLFVHVVVAANLRQSYWNGSLNKRLAVLAGRARIREVFATTPYAQSLILDRTTCAVVARARA